MLVDSDQRHGLGCRRIAQAFQDTGARQTHAAFRPSLFSFDQLSVFGTMHGIGRDGPFPIAALVYRNDPPAFSSGTEYTQDTLRIGTDPPNQPRLVMIIFVLHQRQPCKDAITGPHRRVRGSGNKKYSRLNAVALPFHRLGKKVAVFVRSSDL